MGFSDIEILLKAELEVVRSEEMTQEEKDRAVKAIEEVRRKRDNSDVQERNKVLNIVLHQLHKEHPMTSEGECVLRRCKEIVEQEMSGSIYKSQRMEEEARKKGMGSERNKAVEEMEALREENENLKKVNNVYHFSRARIQAKIDALESARRSIEKDRRDQPLEEIRKLKNMFERDLNNSKGVSQSFKEDVMNTCNILKADIREVMWASNSHNIKSQLEKVNDHLDRLLNRSKEPHL